MYNLKLFSLILTCGSLAAAAASPFAGLTGREILAKINLTMRPTDYVEQQTGNNGVWATVYDYATNGDGLLIDYFDATHTIATTSDQPSGLYLINVAPIAWWGTSNYGTAPALDLHNIITAGAEVAALKSDLPPGLVTTPSYDNGTWCVGVGSYYGVDAPMYTPPRGREGDFARALMYCATMYPMELWCGKGYYIYADGTYPLLSEYGKDLLMMWHRADPVDEFELKRNSTISARQGNDNPFVTYPDLAEYIWGNLTDQAVEQPDNQPTVQPSLKATYSIAADSVLTLSSPYLPEDLDWSIDGIAATAATVSLQSLTLGEHILSYHNSDLSGVIKIFITK